MLALDIVRSHQRTIPVDVYAIARDLGIHVREELLPETVSAKIENLGGVPERFVITLNARHHPNRKRFSLAHELAHYLLHRDQFREIVDNTMYRQDGKTLDAHKERQANQLAANILMPYPLIKDQKRRGYRTPEALARLFEVSPEAMGIRLAQARPVRAYQLEAEED